MCCTITLQLQHQAGLSQLVLWQGALDTQPLMLCLSCRCVRLCCSLAEAHIRRTPPVRQEMALHEAACAQLPAALGLSSGPQWRLTWYPPDRQQSSGLVCQPDKQRLRHAAQAAHALHHLAELLPSVLSSSLTHRSRPSRSYSAPARLVQDFSSLCGIDQFSPCCSELRVLTLAASPSCWSSSGGVRTRFRFARHQGTGPVRLGIQLPGCRSDLHSAWYAARLLRSIQLRCCMEARCAQADMRSAASAGRSLSLCSQRCCLGSAA